MLVDGLPRAASNVRLDSELVCDFFKFRQAYAPSFRRAAKLDRREISVMFCNLHLLFL